MQERRMPLIEEASSSFYQPIFHVPGDKEERSVLPCVIFLEDMQSMKRFINIDQLCEGKSPKEKAEMRSRINMWLLLQKANQKPRDLHK